MCSIYTNTTGLSGSTRKRRCPHKRNNISFWSQSMSSHGSRMPFCEPDPLHKAVRRGFSSHPKLVIGGFRDDKAAVRPQHLNGAEKALKGGGLLLLCLEHSFACQTPRPFFPECDAVDKLSKEGFTLSWCSLCFDDGADAQDRESSCNSPVSAKTLLLGSRGLHIKCTVGGR